VIGMLGGQPDFSALKLGSIAVGNFINAIVAFSSSHGILLLIVLPFSRMRPGWPPPPRRRPRRSCCARSGTLGAAEGVSSLLERPALQARGATGRTGRDQREETATRVLYSPRPARPPAEGRRERSPRPEPRAHPVPAEVQAHGAEPEPRAQGHDDGAARKAEGKPLMPPIKVPADPHQPTGREALAWTRSAWTDLEGYPGPGSANDPVHGIVERARNSSAMARPPGA
jgi:hypothetical protein